MVFHWNWITLCSQPRGCRPCGAGSILLLEQANSFDIWEGLGWNLHLLPRDMLQQPIDCNCLTCTKLLPPPHFGIVLNAKQRYKALLVLKEPFNQKGCQCSSLISIGSFWDESRGASPGSEPCLDLGYQKAQIPFSLCWLIYMFTGCKHIGLYLWLCRKQRV